MPLFALIGRDASDGATRRREHRQAHLDNLAAADREGRVVHGGPLLDAAGAPCGSLIVFQAESLEAARAFAASDPYITGGVFASYDVFETKVVFPGQPPGTPRF